VVAVRESNLKFDRKLTPNVSMYPFPCKYSTLINAHAKSSERGSAARAEHVLQVMKQRYLDGDEDFKPNTRTYTSCIDAWAKSGEKGSARRAEQILNDMISSYESSGDPDIKPNVHTANAVCNVSLQHDSNQSIAIDCFRNLLYPIFITLTLL
jgi:hypothetical protein